MHNELNMQAVGQQGISMQNNEDTTVFRAILAIAVQA